MKKYSIIFLVLIFSVLFARGQEFEYWVSDLDKAAYERITYRVSSDSIQVKSGPYDFIYFSKDYEKDKVIFSKALDSVEQVKLRKLGEVLSNDSLKSQYTNLCIIDGMILHFHFEWREQTMSTTLANYYLEKMTPFVEFINTLLADRFKIGYNKEWLQKVMADCPDSYILD